MGGDAPRLGLPWMTCCQGRGSDNGGLVGVSIAAAAAAAHPGRRHGTARGWQAQWQAIGRISSCSCCRSVNEFRASGSCAASGRQGRGTVVACRLFVVYLRMLLVSAGHQYVEAAHPAGSSKLGRQWAGLDGAL